METLFEMFELSQVMDTLLEYFQYEPNYGYFLLS